MKNRVSLLIAGFAIMFLAGCATKPDSYANYRQIMVLVTDDQKFVIGDEKVDVTEFVDKADFDRQSPEVILIVDKKSKVMESTMIELIKIFQSRGYVVHMAPESKYADLVAKVGKL